MRKLFQKLLALVAVAALVLSIAPAAMGEGASAGAALDSTGDCSFKASPSGMKISTLSDRKLRTVWNSNPAANPWIEISAPSGVPICGLFIKFGKSVPSSYVIQKDTDGAWENACEGNGLLHAYYAFPEGVKRLRIYVTEDSTKSVLSVSEIYALTDGTLPDWVETWHEAEKADALVLTGRVTDEVSIYGSLIPSIAGHEVVVAPLSCPSTERRSEMMSALWKTGLRVQPDIRIAKETAAKSAEAAYTANGGESAVTGWVMELIRKYKPEVIFAPGLEKTDGFYQNGIVGQSAINAFALSGDDSQFYDTALTYGTWEAKKLYIHGGQPLPGVENGDNLAKAAYESYTHEKTDLSYEERLAKFGGNVFTLQENTTDAAFEDIWGGTEITLWAPDSTPAPIVRAPQEPYYMSKLPPMNAKGFLDEGEFVYDSDQEGLYIFMNNECRVVITRKEDKSQPLVWFETEIWTDIENGVIPQNYWADPVKKAKVVKNAADTAKENHLAFAMNTDYFYYRTASSGSRHVGVVIRNGEILHDDRYPEPSGQFPNLDTLAVYSDGRMEALDGSAKSAQKFIDDGAVNVYSFGPLLIHQGELRKNLEKISHSNNPRCALGMIEPGHYMAIMCEGRLKDSGGISVTQLALMMRAKGCVEACNMDGGQTCVVEFMGRQLNRIGKYDGKTAARSTTDVLGVGITDQVNP